MEPHVDTQSPVSGNSRSALRGGAWGHLMVSASACVLTVSIVGSGVFLANRLYGRYQTRGVIREFLGSLENRTPQELDDSIARLRERPKLVEQMLPEMVRALRNAHSEEQLCAVIRVCQPFLRHKRVRDALFELRGDGRESVAAAAVLALSKSEPSEHAAQILGRCLDDVPAGVLGPAAVDRLCSGLYELGGQGLETIRPKLMNLPIDRRVWLVGYVAGAGGPHRDGWLLMLQSDPDARVRSAAQQALHPAPEGPLAKSNN